MPDCAFCHTAVESAPSLARLVPGGRVVLRLALLDAAGRPLGDEAQAPWRDDLAAALAANDVAAVTATDGAAPTLDVEIRRTEGTGRTDAGTEFGAVRYDAVLRLGRATVGVRGAPIVAREAGARAAARAELVARIAPVVAF